MIFISGQIRGDTSTVSLTDPIKIALNIKIF